MKELKYFLLTSIRRQMIDEDLKELRKIFIGKILDVGGGRKRGNFVHAPYTDVTIVDINKKFKPDLVANVEKLPFSKESFNVVKAIELFEHVKNPEKGIAECARVLKVRGFFVFSVPFLYPIHADPFDYQRWTEYKLKKILSKYNFKIKKFKIQGYYFSVLADFIKTPLLKFPFYLRYPLYFFVFPYCKLLLWLDKIFGKKDLFKGYHQGYFIVCQKK